MTNSSIGTREQLRDPNYTPPLAKAIPLGIQHVLAMFVSNVTPAIIIAGAAFDFGSGLFSGSADVIDPVTQERLSLTPAGANSFYGSYFNDATNQLVVTADGTAYVYAIPAPASAAVLGLLALPRRRRTGAAS